MAAQQFLDDTKKNKMEKIDKETALATIADALYATNRISVYDYQEIAEGVLQYISDHNMRIVRN